jgi:hypothetical protein
MRGGPPPEANDAHWLLDLYRSFFTAPLAGDDDTSKRALESLAQVGARGGGRAGGERAGGGGRAGGSEGRGRAWRAALCATDLPPLLHHGSPKAPTLRPLPPAPPPLVKPRSRAALLS